mgnify:FL=1
MIKDPVDSLIQYVQTIKPYHSKIVEVLVDHIHDEDMYVGCVDTIKFYVQMLYDFHEDPDRAGFDADLFEEQPFELPDYQYGVPDDNGFSVDDYDQTPYASSVQNDRISETTIGAAFTETITFSETMYFNDDLGVFVGDPQQTVGFATFGFGVRPFEEAGIPEFVGDPQQTAGFETSGFDDQPFEAGIPEIFIPHQVGYDGFAFDSTPYDYTYYTIGPDDYVWIDTGVYDPITNPTAEPSVVYPNVITITRS